MTDHGSLLEAKANRSESPVAVVTGATGGIGDAVARELHNSGYRLVLSARSRSKLESLLDELGDAVRIVDADIVDPQTPQRLLMEAINAFGRCDICVNNAGILEVGSIEKIDIDRVSAMVRINVEGTFRTAYTLARHFHSVGAGHLINVSSVLGTKVRATAGAYAGTKAAIEALSEALRMELAKTDVKISCIQPGLVSTHLHDGWPVPPSEEMGIPVPLTPADIARTVLFVLQQPDHIRLPTIMLLPKGHVI